MFSTLCKYLFKIREMAALTNFKDIFCELFVDLVQIIHVSLNRKLQVRHEGLKRTRDWNILSFNSSL